MPEARGRPAAELLADRIAATLVNHEPGWQLPRPSAIARRHNVGDGEIQASIDELVSRQLVRRSPDGRVYQASPAEYLIPSRAWPASAPASTRWAATSPA